MQCITTCTRHCNIVQRDARTLSSVARSHADLLSQVALLAYLATLIVPPSLLLNLTPVRRAACSVLHAGERGRGRTQTALLVCLYPVAADVTEVGPMSCAVRVGRTGEEGASRWLSPFSPCPRSTAVGPHLCY